MGAGTQLAEREIGQEVERDSYIEGLLSSSVATIYQYISRYIISRYDTRHDIDIVVSTCIRGARGIPAARGTIAKNVCRV